MRHVVHPSLLLSAVLALVACGASEPPPPPPTPSPTPQATPTPPPKLEPVTLHHVVFEEVLAAPPGLLTSPLHRALPPVPEGGPSGEFLRQDGASDAAVEALEALSRGEGASGDHLALVEWRMSWGVEASAGHSRHWGVCTLPCTLDDAFVASRGHHPADPVSNPRVLFAGRPGAVGPTLKLDGTGLRVRHGETSLWADGEAGPALEAKASVDVPFLEADGVNQETKTWEQARRLSVLAATSRTLPLSARAEPIPNTARVLPELPERPHKPRRRGVEGVTEVWPWPDATIFEGGFSVKPDPAAAGLEFKRHEQRVLWTPTTHQADQRDATFATYTLKRPSGMTASVAPFPLGVDVLASFPALGERFRIAFAADPNLQGRARQIVSRFEEWNKTLPAPTLEHVQVVYVMDEATTLVPGSAGEASHGFSVDDAWSEYASVQRVWGRITLGVNGGLDTPQIADWLAHVDATIEETDDPSWLTRTFASAGEDVRNVWLEWLQNPEHAGAPDPEAFLTFVARQLPDLSRDLRDRLARRSFVLDRVREGMPWTPPPEDAPGDPAEPADPALAEATPEPTPVPAATPAPPPPAPPELAITGGSAIEAAWHWLPWPDGLERADRALRVDAREGSTVSWFVAPLSEEGLAALGTDREARQALAAGWKTAHRGATPKDAPLPLALEGADGILLGVWGAADWAAGFAVVDAPPPQAE